MMPAAIMTNPLLKFLAVLFYLGAGTLLAYSLTRDRAASGTQRATLLAIGAAAVVLHAFILYDGAQPPDGINLSFTGAFALVAWVVACLYLIASLWRPVDNLGVIVMPVAALTVILDWLVPATAPVALSSRPQAVHIVVALVAYSLLCLAAIQSVMLLLQENRLRHKQPGGFLRALPPIQTMEATLFQMIALGFALLTVTLVTGIVFSERLFGTPFKFTHHIVLAALGWAVYAVLLLGHWRFGWRGRTAVRWTLGGFALLVLAYFGSKFVLQVILAR